MGMFDDLIPGKSGGMFDDLIPASGSAKPFVPTYVRDASGRETALTPEQLADLQGRQKAAREAEQAEFDKTRTPGERAKGTATFLGSIPVRALTQGKIGLGDLVGLASPETGNALARQETDFVRANQGENALATWDPRDIASLATLSAVGEIGAGIPAFSTMGAVPGQMLSTSRAALRELPREARQLLRSERGALALPNGGRVPPSGGATPPPPPPTAVPAPAGPARLPNRGETFQAAADIKQGLGTQVDIPEMVAGGKVKQTVAAGLRSVPFAGEPIENAFQKGLQQLGEARTAAAKSLGAVGGQEATGAGLQRGALTWMAKNSKDHVRSFYDTVYNGVDEAITRPLNRTAKLVDDFKAEMKRSTGTAPAAAIKKVEDALARPEGLGVRGLSELRSEIGDLVDEATVNKGPGQRAYSRLYGAVTDDLKATVRQAGGPEALRAWELANREARIVAGKRSRLAKIVGLSEDKLNAEAVFKRAESAALEGGNIRELRLLKQVVGQDEWGNFGAEIVNRMGTAPQTGLFSGDRFLTAYGKISDAGKQALFGPAKQHLDNIATIAKKYGELSSKFNRSNTGIVNAVLKLMANPTLAAANIGTAMVNPAAAFTIAGQAAGVASMRATAWALAKPSTLNKASGVLRTYYNAELARAGRMAASAVAKREQEFASALRSFSLEVARETGQSADDIEKALREQITPQGQGHKP